MITRRKTTINRERHETMAIKGSNRLRTAQCPDCSGRVALIGLNEAVRISGLSSRSVYRLIERGQIHFAETTDGVALICPASLLEITRKSTEEL
jgi:hypothetical protein